MNEEPVIIEERDAGNGRRIGLATLNAPKSLNALTVPMIERLRPQLAAWADDSGIACVVLAGAGEKAFCAGGDIVSMYRAIQEHPGGPVPFAERFFEQEYRLDHAIHTYPKPILVWGQGVVMGGGLGLMVGASHRVVTEGAKIAMPEITIGLYPDVAGTWFLNRMPGRVGLFLGLTGARMNAADALYTGLADYLITADQREPVLAALQEIPWEADPELNRGHLSVLLRRFADASREARPASNVLRHMDLIDHVTDHHSVQGILAALDAYAGEDDWVDAALATLRAGSPTSARVILEQYRRGKYLSLREVFMRELNMSVRCVRGHDYPEGVRALLIDKDRNPRWDPPTVDQVSDELVASFFIPAEGMDPNPLRDL